jgi:hypothetical protein
MEQADYLHFAEDYANHVRVGPDRPLRPFSFMELAGERAKRSGELPLTETWGSAYIHSTGAHPWFDPTNGARKLKRRGGFLLDVATLNYLFSHFRGMIP